MEYRESVLNFIFLLNWVSSLLLDAFRHFIRVQFKNSCSSDGQGSQNFEDFSFNQSWIASVIGVGDEISDLKVEIPKRLETSIGLVDPPSLLLPAKANVNLLQLGERATL